MTFKKYLKHNTKYIMIVIAWLILTVGFTVYKTNISNNFYIEAADTAIENITRIDVIDNSNKSVMHVKPIVNGDKAFMHFERIDIKKQYRLKITNVSHLVKTIPFPYTTDTDYLKVRLVKVGNSYVIMAISDKTSIPMITFVLLWGTLAVLIILTIYDFLHLRKAYKMPKHTLTMYFDLPTNITEITLYDPLLKYYMTYKQVDILKHQENGMSYVLVDTVLFSKTRSMKIKVKTSQRDQFLYRKQLMRYTSTTRIEFSNQNDAIIDLASGAVIRPYKSKYA